MKAYKVKRRKVFLINKEVQVRFVLASLVYIVVYFFVLASLVFIPVAYSLLTKASLPEQYEAALDHIAELE